MKRILLTLGAATVALSPVAAFSIYYNYNKESISSKIDEYTLPEKAQLTMYKQTTIDEYKNQLISLLNNYLDADNKEIDTWALSYSKTIDEALSAFNEINNGTLKYPDQITKATPDKPELPAFDYWDTSSPQYINFISRIKSLFSGLYDGIPFNYSSLDNPSWRRAFWFDNGIENLVNQAKTGNGNLPPENLAALENLTITNTHWNEYTIEATIYNIISAAKIMRVPVDLTGKISWLDDNNYSAEKTLAEATRLIRLEFPEFDPDDVRGNNGNGWDFELFPYSDIDSDSWYAGINAARALTNGFAASKTDMDTSTITGDTPEIVKANARLLAVDHSDNLGSDASHINVDIIDSPTTNLYKTSTFNDIKQNYFDIVSNPLLRDGEEKINTKPFVDATTVDELNASWDAIEFYVHLIGENVNVALPNEPSKDYIEQSKLIEWVNRIKESFEKIKEDEKTKEFFMALDRLVENDDENENNNQALIDSIQTLSEDFLKTVI